MKRKHFKKSDKLKFLGIRVTEKIFNRIQDGAINDRISVNLYVNEMFEKFFQEESVGRGK